MIVFLIVTNGLSFVFTTSMQAASKLKNIDRENGRDIEVTVNDVTITITDYKLLSKSRSMEEEESLKVEE